MSADQTEELQVLIVDDSEDDALLVIRELENAGYEVKSRRVDDPDRVRNSLRNENWDLVVSDYSMPSFTGLEALSIYRECDLDIPFIVISGTIGEDVAVQTMKAGAHDYVMKDSLTRLGPAVRRELSEARIRAQNRRGGEALREQEERLRTLINAMPDIVCFKDGEGRWLEANDFDLKLFGLAGVDYHGKKDSDLAEYSDFYREAFLTCEESDEVAWEARGISRGEEVIPRPDGPPKIFDIIKVPMFNRDGTRKGLVVVGRDITERKEAEGESERLSMAIEQAAEAVVMTDVDGIIQYINPAFEKTTGYSRDEAIGRNPRMLKSEKQDPAFYEKLWATISSGNVWSGRLVNRKKNGTHYDQETVISPVKAASGEIINYVAVARDVSHEVALRSQLIQSQKMEAVGKLAGGVAHDFNNLLMVILNDALFVREAMDSSLPSCSDMDEIVQTANRGADLARRLLAFSRQQMITPKVVDLNNIARGVERMLMRIIGEDVRMQFNLWREPLNVKVDAGQIEQVIMNLALNARDAMPGGGTLTILTRQGCSDADKDVAAACQRGKCAVLQVIDTGQGIREDIKERVFEPFFTTKDVGQGTGLGLSTVYGIIHQHGGEVLLD
ncbi:MAG: PAS domain S-box protein, partial [Verrucomicrobia bacterium]|nr:PAS domain S-box protein [Verrucomicrobiota bacterium]